MTYDSGQIQTKSHLSNTIRSYFETKNPRLFISASFISVRISDKQSFKRELIYFLHQGFEISALVSPCMDYSSKVLMNNGRTQTATLPWPENQKTGIQISLF